MDHINIINDVWKMSLYTHELEFSFLSQWLTFLQEEKAT